MIFNVKKWKIQVLKLGFLKNKRNLLKIGIVISFQLLFGNGFHIWVSNVMGNIFHQKFPDFDKVFWNEILTILPFFSKFPNFSVVSFVLNQWIHYWIACDDLETRRKGKAPLVGWFCIIEASWFLNLVEFIWTL